MVVNLASQEYAKAVDRRVLKARVIDCVFEEWKGGGYKIISFAAKKARGLMARYAIERRIDTPRKLQGFDLEGYAFDPGASQGRAAGVPAQDETMSTAQTQQVTPQLRQWIVEQAEAGHSAEAVLKSMLASGWQEDVAVDALESTLRGHLEQKAVQQGLPPALPVPDPELDEVAAVPRRGRPPGLRAAGHVQPAGGRLRRAAVRRGVRGADRTGQAAAGPLADGRHRRPAARKSMPTAPATACSSSAPRTNWCGASRRASPGWSTGREENGEGLQILHYRPGTEYKPHYDYFDPAQPGTPTILQRGGQRVGTLVMYLGEPEKGGGTVFPDVHLEIAPKRGNAVFFTYERPHPSTRTLHGGSPVLAGEKWIATKWLRERRFV